jgi:hypothetical protein
MTHRYPPGADIASHRCQKAIAQLPGSFLQRATSLVTISIYIPPAGSDRDTQGASQGDDIAGIRLGLSAAELVV